MAYKFDLSRGEEILLKVAAISAAALAIVNVFQFYKNNIYHPIVEVKDVDFNKGVAHLLIDGKPKTIKGESSYLIGNEWSVKLGATFSSSSRKYDRIEILKRGNVDSVIKTAEGEEMQSFTANGDEWVMCNHCGWSWNTRQSSPSDKYVCHKCGEKNASVIGGGEGEWVNRSFVGLPKDKIW